tara:strand:+ start:1951 stop:2604 length:654 start_codon:yes stop_codon:yes gene_type:complete
MRIESKLCHISENKAVVQVSGWLNEKMLGSALAEGPTVELAEEKAISRLDKRIKSLTDNDTRINPINEDRIKTPLKVELPKSEKIDKVNINNEPNDWSNELTAIDSEIERLKWSREDEINFLEKSLGYNNRNKITNYNDIVIYLGLLKKIDRPSKNNEFKGNINTLIEESDNILKDLSWNHIRGREFLQKEFNVSTRKELNEEQLISFVAKLKSIRN